ncbi:hypothetical protein [Agrococcus sp. SGAir0287]|uniref:hypothetical protein n=1 Tax=Agrococcus sp. SGAir0287 TaxID=2070347 RepID=UPI0010CD66FC|nr:hypothetical protein [Agrococcus sp. SGAir0287]QCR20745.1 hypothetical protein C1N71_07885 [Agrococcus sp. SGAir0287]
MHELAQVAAVVASSDGEGYLLALLAAGPVAGIAVYASIYRRYRNQDKTHVFERETRIAASPVQGDDTKVDEVIGTRRRRIDGDLIDQPRVRVRRVP